MKSFLQTPLFKIGAAAMATAAAGVAVLFVYALNAPTQPLPPDWRVTVVAAEAAGGPQPSLGTAH